MRRFQGEAKRIMCEAVRRHASLAGVDYRSFGWYISDFLAAELVKKSTCSNRRCEDSVYFDPTVGELLKCPIYSNEN
jgi:hypothetical protein